VCALAESYQEAFVSASLLIKYSKLEGTSMAPSSITIRIDFDHESVTGTTNKISFQGDIPTPFTSGGFSSTAIGQSTDALPTPFDNPELSMTVVHDQAPTPFSGTVDYTYLTAPDPSPDLDPVRNTGKEDAVTQSEGVPITGKKRKK
jgi:hypothetical protein